MARTGIFAAALLAGLCGTSLSAEAASLQLRVVVPCGASDKPLVLEGTTHEVCLSSDSVIDEAGVVRAQRYPVIAKVIVDITPAASDKLYAATQANVGHDLAVVFQGKLIFKAAITEALKLDKFQLTLNNAPEQVDALVDAFPGPKS